MHPQTWHIYMYTWISLGACSRIHVNCLYISAEHNMENQHQRDMSLDVCRRLRQNIRELVLYPAEKRIGNPQERYNTCLVRLSGPSRGAGLSPPREDLVGRAPEARVHYVFRSLMYP